MFGCVQARASMQAEMAIKEAEAERQRARIKELEAMQQRLEEALQQEIKARQDEEAFRYAQAGWAAAHKHCWATHPCSVSHTDVITGLFGALFAFSIKCTGLCLTKQGAKTL